MLKPAASHPPSTSENDRQTDRDPVRGMCSTDRQSSHHDRLQIIYIDPHRDHPHMNPDTTRITWPKTPQFGL